jgi:phosphoribosylanthranilate isomerase
VTTAARAEPVRVKICGVTRPEDAEAAVAAGADLIGLNFHPGSKRYVTLDEARAVAAAVRGKVRLVGVFVDASREEIERVREAVGLDAVQLHGDEPPELDGGFTVQVIRAVRIREAGDVARALATFAPDYFLCEGDAGPAYGGAGARFDWRWASDVPRERLFVAGGLTPDNVADAVRLLRPFAVDVASGVESAPRVKDKDKMAALVAHAKAA